jgi:hypothetical protein
MKNSELKEIIFACTHGAPELRRRKAAEAKLRLGQDVARLRDKAAAQCEEFRRRLEAWTSSAVSGTPRPLTIEQDRRDARLVNLIAWVLTVTELALTFWLAVVFGIPPLFLLLLAVVAIFALKAGLLAVWRNDAQPQETRLRLRNFVIIPSLVVTMLSAAALVFARGVGGAAVLLLLPLLNLALCALSLGCLGLAAGLFALGYLLLWSHYAERRFNAVEREAVENLRVLRQVEKIEEELKAERTGPPAPPAAPAAGSTSSLQEQAARVGAPLFEKDRSAIKKATSLLPLALFIALLSGGCSLPGGATGAAAAGDPATATVTPARGAAGQETAAQETAMEVWLDWSLSTEAGAYREAVKALIAGLPEVAARHRVVRFAAYQFAGSGWNATELLRLDLPVPEQAETSETGAIFGRNAQREQAERRYAAQLREKLAEVTEAKLLPGEVGEPRCTDLQGALSRIAQVRRPLRRIVVLLTDGQDTCSRRLRPVSLASANAAVVVMLLPEHSRREAQPLAHESWEETRAKLAQALPGAAIIPHFADPLGAVNDALAK